MSSDTNFANHLTQTAALAAQSLIAQSADAAMRNRFARRPKAGS